MDPSNIVRRTATGDITTATSYLRGVTLTCAAAAASVVVRAGGASGTIVLTLATPATSPTTVVSGDLSGAFCSGGIHVTLTGAGAEVSVVYV